MGYWVDSTAASKATEGKLLGRTEPCRETKYSWWQVYYKDGIITACVFFDGVVTCGEEIEEKELSMYVDDDAEALKLLADAKLK